MRLFFFEKIIDFLLGSIEDDPDGFLESMPRRSIRIIVFF